MTDSEMFRKSWRVGRGQLELVRYVHVYGHRDRRFVYQVHVIWDTKRTA